MMSAQNSNVYETINSKVFMPRQVRDLRLVMNSTIKHASNVYMQDNIHNLSYETSTKNAVSIL